MSSHKMIRPRPGISKKLKELMLKSDNRFCADCGARDPKWASANIGVFICIKCSGVHRSLGSHISKVLPVTLDEWSEEEIQSMVEVGGNSYANATYEAFLPKTYKKPRPDASDEDRARFIRVHNGRGEEQSEPCLERGAEILRSPESRSTEIASVRPRLALGRRHNGGGRDRHPASRHGRHGLWGRRAAGGHADREVAEDERQRAHPRQHRQHRGRQDQAGGPAEAPERRVRRAGARSALATARPVSDVGVDVSRSDQLYQSFVC